jgi:hypothetical protein
MTSVSSSNSYASLFAASAMPNWLASTITAIQNQANQGGLLGMLANAGNNNGSISSFLSSSVSNANAFATIATSSVTNTSSLVAQIAAQNQQDQQAKQLEDAFTALQSSQQEIQPKNVLDPIIYFDDGSTIDTNANILTMQNGTQIDTTTGTKVIDPASLIQLANGAYLDTQNNILTMPDGTEIDTVTGLKISTTA